MIWLITSLRHRQSKIEKQHSSKKMANQPDLEQRLAAVELTLSELQKQISANPPSNWITAITGTFKDEPAFDEVLAYGREFRQADRTQPEDIE
jgi:hypothetical protein